jgi:hypothetical protein
MCCPAAAVSLSSGSAIPTAGGVEITVHGSWLGLNSSLISLVYTGGVVGMPVHTYISTSCRVMAANTAVSCTAVPGVGGNYSFQLVVDGGASEWSNDTLSYAPPIITSISGAGAVRSASKVSSCGGGCVCVWGGEKACASVQDMTCFHVPLVEVAVARAANIR